MWIIYDHPEEPARITACQLHSEEESATCLAIQFFDDEELVLLLEETESGQRYLVTVRYADLLEDMSIVPEDMGMWDVSMLVEMGKREVTVSTELARTPYPQMIVDKYGRNFPLFLSLDADHWPLGILRLSSLL